MLAQNQLKKGSAFDTFDVIQYLVRNEFILMADNRRILILDVLNQSFASEFDRNVVSGKEWVRYYSIEIHMKWNRQVFKFHQILFNI